MGVCGAGVLGLARWRFGRGAHPPGPPPRLAVVVLGFRDLSAQPRAAWLATALSEWLTTELAAGHQLRLVPQQGVARMRAELRLPLGESLTAGSLARVRADCGADIVVAGAYALLGARSVEPMRLDIVVQDTRTGATLLALHQSGAATHLLSLVARAGARLRAGLGVGPVTAMQAAEVRRALPAAPAAARDYAEGLAHLRVFDAIAARRWMSAGSFTAGRDLSSRSAHPWTGKRRHGNEPSQASSAGCQYGQPPGGGHDDARDSGRPACRPAGLPGPIRAGALPPGPGSGRSSRRANVLQDRVALGAAGESAGPDGASRCIHP